MVYTGSRPIINSLRSTSPKTFEDLRCNSDIELLLRFKTLIFEIVSLNFAYSTSTWKYLTFTFDLFNKLLNDCSNPRFQWFISNSIINPKLQVPVIAVTEDSMSRLVSVIVIKKFSKIWRRFVNPTIKAIWNEFEAPATYKIWSNIGFY